MVEEAEEQGAKKKRGPKGGIPHTPGRGHARKSQPLKKQRIAKRLREKHQARRAKAQAEKEKLEAMDPEVRKLLYGKDKK